jgi:hypothetical protein
MASPEDEPQLIPSPPARVREIFRCAIIAGHEMAEANPRLRRKVLAINAHNPTNAFARPLAKKAVGGT